VSEQEILEIVGRLEDPELGRSFSDLKMIKSVTAAEKEPAQVCIELPTPAYPQPERITERIQSALSNFGDVNVELTSTVRGNETGGKVGLKVKNVIAVGSGKGGVGKSTVAATLAFGLQTYGAKVGLVDADVYGPSIPHLTGTTGPPAMVQYQTADGQTYERMQPIEVGGVKLMSIGFIVKPEQAVIWRGPMLHKALTDFLQRTEWEELDYLVIDMPPGTGDVALTLSQTLNLAGAVIVCTPQQVALLDAVKAVNMFRQVKIPLLGVVENMTGDIFGRGGAKQKAEEMNITFLGELPIDAGIREFGDAGKIAELLEEGNPARPHLRNIVEQTAMEIVRQSLDKPGLPTLEIL